MSEQHIFDDIPRLLTGEADRATVHAAAEHLRGCEDCHEELVSAVVAHASLSSAARFAPEIIGRPVVDADPFRDPVTPPALPDLSAIFAQVRDENDAASAADDTPPSDEIATRRAARIARPGRRRQWLVAAGIVGLAVGGSGVYLADRAGEASQSQAVAVSRYGIGTVDASATLTDNRTISLDASKLAALPRNQYYEVWLTDGARTHMAAVGQLDAARRLTATVAPSTVDSYSAIEVTVQEVDSPGAPSNASVLRGNYR